MTRTRAESPLRQFQLLVDDDRYDAPTLHLVVVGDVIRALAEAERLIDRSTHHRGVEICEHGRRLFGLGSRAQAPRGAADAAA